MHEVTLHHDVAQGPTPFASEEGAISVTLEELHRRPCGVPGAGELLQYSSYCTLGTSAS